MPRFILQLVTPGQCYVLVFSLVRATGIESTISPGRFLIPDFVSVRVGGYQHNLLEGIVADQFWLR